MAPSSFFSPLSVAVITSAGCPGPGSSDSPPPSHPVENADLLLQSLEYSLILSRAIYAVFTHHSKLASRDKTYLPSPTHSVLLQVLQYLGWWARAVSVKLLKDPSRREENRCGRKREKWNSTDRAQKILTLEWLSIWREKNTLSVRTRALVLLRRGACFLVCGCDDWKFSIINEY